MSGMIIRLLVILGWILLAAVLLLLFLLLLVLFYPISYRLYGIRDVERMEVSVKVRWLLGLVSVRFCYPQPGNLVAKVFGIPVLDTSREKKKRPEKEEGKDRKADRVEGKDRKPDQAEKKNEKPGQAAEADKGSDNVTNSSRSDQGEAGSKDQKEAASGDREKVASNDRDGSGQSGESVFQAFFQALEEKWEKLKEEQNKLYQTASDVIEKLKKAFRQFQYYLELIQKEDSRLLFASGFFRLGRILKTIRPRKIKGQILIGTGSPDTTGYCMAAYGMLLPFLGKNISVTPDFEKAVFQGELFVRGRISVAVLLFHGAHVLLDRRLHSFVKQLKMEGR